MTAAELFDQARQGLEMHRLRATLSLLGIVVGIGTVVASLAVGEGARRAAMQDIAALGIDNVFARAVAGADNPRARAAAPELTREDAAAIQSGIAGVEGVAVTRFTRAEIVAASRTAAAAVAGVSTGWSRLANVGCARGRCLAAEDERASRRVAVLGPSLAMALAPGRDPIGLSVAVNGEVLEVVGVLQATERRASAAALQAFSPEDAVLMPISVMDAKLGEGDAMDRVSEIGVHVAQGSDVSAVSAAVEGLLRRRHPGAGDRYELVVPRELLRARLRAERTFDAVLFATGLIALIIAGVGIMNVMLASVTERKQEIGVRVAVGARRADVVAQFTLEAGLLCLAGGLIGVPLGGALSWEVSVLAGWPVTISPGGVGLALALAVAVGLAFGIYPAYLAASTDPIDALRG
jgi:putative ABC transport system permease protein